MNLYIVNQFNKSVDLNMEKPEQELAKKHIKSDDCVLELGARYGTVSCTINSKLKDKTKQVSVEPDSRVWEALEINKKHNECKFNIVKGFVSQKKIGLTNLNVHHGGYGSTFTDDIQQENVAQCEHYTLEAIEMQYKLKFNVLVADCEGFLERFFDENPTFINQLRLIIYEADYPKKCNYNKIKSTLIKQGFMCIESGHQNVWLR